MLTVDSEESDQMRAFFGVDNGARVTHSNVGSVTVDAASCVSSSTLGSGSVTSSVLSIVRCNSIQADGCVLINVTAVRIVARPGRYVNHSPPPHPGFSLARTHHHRVPRAPPYP